MNKIKIEKIKFKIWCYKEIFFITIKNIKRKIWNKYILHVWNNLYIRKDEFHKSLDLDLNAMLVMDKKEREKYYKNIMKRRNIAHEKDLKNI